MRPQRLRKKLKLKEKRYEVKQLIKSKVSEDYDVLEEVFDFPTHMAIYKLLKRNVISSLQCVVKTGKESRIYWAKDEKGGDLAVKIFLTSAAEFRRGMLPYIEGDPRFKGIRRSRRALVYAWATKEFKNLKRAHESGVRVPMPIAVLNNVLVMTFVGRDGVPAPLMKESEIRNPKALYKETLRVTKRLFKEAGLVHGDLSEYNVMLWDGKPVLFDFSQAVTLEHPRAEELLRRDLYNITKYFKRLGVEVDPIEKIERWIRS